MYQQRHKTKIKPVMLTLGCICRIRETGGRVLYARSLVVPHSPAGFWGMGGHSRLMQGPASAVRAMSGIVRRLWHGQSSQEPDAMASTADSDEYERDEDDFSDPCPSADDQPMSACRLSASYVYDMCMVVDCFQWRDDMTACVKGRFRDAEIRVVSSSGSLSGFCIAIRVLPAVHARTVASGDPPSAGCSQAAECGYKSLLSGGYQIVRQFHANSSEDGDSTCQSQSSPVHRLWRCAHSSMFSQNALGIMIMCGIIYSTYLADSCLKKMFQATHKSLADSEM